VSLSSFIFHEAIHLGSGHRREECVFGVAVTVLSDFERFYVIFGGGGDQPQSEGSRHTDHGVKTYSYCRKGARVDQVMDQNFYITSTKQIFSNRLLAFF
jgi:hypothetical protein